METVLDNQEKKDGKIDIVIPVYKPDASFQQLIKRLMKQTVPPKHIYLLQTIEHQGEPLLQSGDERVDVYPIYKKDFDHGATRHYGASLCTGEYVLYMTQDAMPADKYLLERLLAAFDAGTLTLEDGQPAGAGGKVAIAYGRQLAREGADILEQLARLHNYPAKSQIKTADDLGRLGIKTYFCSDVCAMYRRDIYGQLGGFVHPTLFNEDMIMAATAIGAGYQVAYCADARVIHSHSYSCMQQFHRNFDLGVSQRQYHEIFDAVSSEKEGAGFAGQTIRYLVGHGKFWKAFYFALQCGFKLAGYQLGKRYDRLPMKLVSACTTNPSYIGFARERE